jgi:hypothetical protein
MRSSKRCARPVCTRGGRDGSPNPAALGFSAGELRGRLCVGGRVALTLEDFEAESGPGGPGHARDACFEEDQREVAREVTRLSVLDGPRKRAAGEVGGWCTRGERSVRCSHLQGSWRAGRGRIRLRMWLQHSTT